MRILQVHNFFQRFGGEDAVALTEEALLREHHELRTYYRDSKDIDAARGLSKGAFALEALYSRRTVKDITEIAGTFKPDIAYVHNIFPLVSPSIYHVLHRLGIPSVHVIHDFRLMCANGRFFRSGRVCEACKGGSYWHGLFNRCMRDSIAYSALYSGMLRLHRRAGVLDKINGFICLTKFSEKLLVDCGVSKDRIYIRPNCIDSTVFEPSSGKGKYVLYVGSLSVEKGLFTLLRAFEQLRDIPLKIVGTGAPDAEFSLKKYISDHALTNIEMLGFKTGEEKYALIRDSQFTVVPSQWYENFPIVILEAFVHGKPVITSNIGSLPYIVEDGKSGKLFEAGNAKQIAAVVRELFNHRTELARMGAYARAKVETSYDASSSYSELMKIFENVIARHSHCQN